MLTGTFPLDFAYPAYDEPDAVGLPRGEEIQLDDDQFYNLRETTYKATTLLDMNRCIVNDRGMIRRVP